MENDEIDLAQRQHSQQREIFLHTTPSRQLPVITMSSGLRGLAPAAVAIAVGVFTGECYPVSSWIDERSDAPIQVTTPFNQHFSN